MNPMGAKRFAPGEAPSWETAVESPDFTIRGGPKAPTARLAGQLTSG